jgi:hypothetical protein
MDSELTHFLDDATEQAYVKGTISYLQTSAAQPTKKLLRPNSSEQ